MNGNRVGSTVLNQSSNPRLAPASAGVGKRNISNKKIQKLNLYNLFTMFVVLDEIMRVSPHMFVLVLIYSEKTAIMCLEWIKKNREYIFLAI